MIEAIGTITVRATPQTILEFVTDLDRYRLADTKITSILQAANLSSGDRTTARYRGRLRGLPTPADTNDVVLQRWSRVDFKGAPNSWIRYLVDFHGWFECVETTDGTVVTHGERFAFRAPGRWIMEPYLRNWLREEMSREMQRLADCLQGPEK